MFFSFFILPKRFIKSWSLVRGFFWEESFFLELNSSESFSLFRLLRFSFPIPSVNNAFWYCLKYLLLHPALFSFRSCWEFVTIWKFYRYLKAGYFGLLLKFGTCSPVIVSTFRFGFIFLLKIFSSIDDPSFSKKFVRIFFSISPLFFESYSELDRFCFQLGIVEL